MKKPCSKVQRCTRQGKRRLSPRTRHRRTARRGQREAVDDRHGGRDLAQLQGDGAEGGTPDQGGDGEQDIRWHRESIRAFAFTIDIIFAACHLSASRACGVAVGQQAHPFAGPEHFVGQLGDGAQFAVVQAHRDLEAGPGVGRVFSTWLPITPPATAPRMPVATEPLPPPICEPPRPPSAAPDMVPTPVFRIDDGDVAHGFDGGHAHDLFVHGSGRRCRRCRKGPGWRSRPGSRPASPGAIQRFMMGSVMDSVKEAARLAADASSLAQFNRPGAGAGTGKPSTNSGPISRKRRSSKKEGFLPSILWPMNWPIQATHEHRRSTAAAR